MDLQSCSKYIGASIKFHPGEICRRCSQMVGYNPNSSPNLNPNLGLIHLRVKRTRVRAKFSKLGLNLLCYGKMPGQILSVFLPIYEPKSHLTAKNDDFFL